MKNLRDLVETCTTWRPSKTRPLRSGLGNGTDALWERSKASLGRRIIAFGCISVLFELIVSDAFILFHPDDQFIRSHYLDLCTVSQIIGILVGGFIARYVNGYIAQRKFLKLRRIESEIGTGTAPK